MRQPARKSVDHTEIRRVLQKVYLFTKNHISGLYLQIALAGKATRRLSPYKRFMGGLCLVSSTPTVWKTMMKTLNQVYASTCNRSGRGKGSSQECQPVRQKRSHEHVEACHVQIRKELSIKRSILCHTSKIKDHMRIVHSMPDQFLYLGC